MSADLCFVSAPGGSEFMRELLDVVADAVRRAGYSARTAVGRYPAPDPNTVYVVVPHEYFVVTPEPSLPSSALRRRTIGFCVEHPGTATFERTSALLPGLGAAVDINNDSTAELRRRGFAVEHFQLGYTPLWDRWGGDLDSGRDLDVTYLGTAERRRSLLLSSYWRDLDTLSVRLLTPPHEPMVRIREDFLTGPAKHELLSRSRVLLNLHREGSQALEWVRVLEAMCNGAVVVTEPSTDLAPLVPGEQLIVTRAGSAGAVAAALVADPERERAMRLAAYDFINERLDLLSSAKLLVELADSLTTVPQAVAGQLSESAKPPSADNVGQRPLAVDTPSWDVRFAGERSLGSARPAAAAEAALLVEQAISARKKEVGRLVPAAYSDTFPGTERADVDVLAVQRPGEPDPDELLMDLLNASILPNKIFVAGDGVATSARAKACELLLHESPLGRGYTRNRLLERSDASKVLVLDPGMRASRFLLERFTATAADVVHCPVGDTVDGLVGALPPESRRLADVPYLGAGYLVTRRLLNALGGWTEDPYLDGLEDHIFWMRVAADHHRSKLVQQVLLHRGRPDPYPRPLDLHPQRVWEKVNSMR